MCLNTDDPKFTYPENSESQTTGKDDIGIALSGGGLVATTYSLGCLRALKELTVLQKLNIFLLVLDHHG